MGNIDEGNHDVGNIEIGNAFQAIVRILYERPLIKHLKYLLLKDGSRIEV